ncbi:MAG: hypothetical protein Q7T50_04590, partial [Candidatus Magasanikbacteria bacterium]|nr:hypothetical protein [Candidatus Magasanikbacteria bacterium]
YLGESFYNKKVIYAKQTEKKGTFGALLSAKKFLKKDERFLVLNGDDINDKEELKKYLEYPRSFGVQKMHMPNYYSIGIDRNKYIEGFRTQTDEEKLSVAFIATGVYVIDTNIFDHPGIVVYGGEYGLPQTILAQKDLYPIKSITTKKWMPINSFEDMKRAENYFKN